MVRSQIWVMLHSVYAWRGLEPTSLPGYLAARGLRSRVAVGSSHGHGRVSVCGGSQIPPRSSRERSDAKAEARRPARGGGTSGSDDLGTMCV